MTTRPSTRPACFAATTEPPERTSGAEAGRAAVESTRATTPEPAPQRKSAAAAHARLAEGRSARPTRPAQSASVPPTTRTAGPAVAVRRLAMIVPAGSAIITNAAASGLNRQISTSSSTPRKSAPTSPAKSVT
jgi:hypothetical protein